MAPASPAVPPPCPRLRLDAPSLQGACTGMPLLAGEGVEGLFPGARPLGGSGAFRLYQHGHYTLGAASLPCPAGRDGGERAARDLYTELLRLAGPRLCRVWNYVPGINQAEPEGRERYQAFCLGRALAFEETLGGAFETQLPAASAVGSDGDRLVVLFASAPGPLVHLENPLQTPAYRYPQRYGPKAPSFARATLVRHADDSTDLFISGTAAIRGHRTVAPGNTAEQLACTLENLEALGLQCGVGRELGAGGLRRRHIKVYLRHPEDLELSRQRLEGRLLQPGDRVSFVRADICRSDLNVEIELSALTPCQA